MIRPPQIPVLADAKLIDAALAKVQTSLIGSLSWLNHAFGKAQQLKETEKTNTYPYKKTVVFPSVYVGGIDYRKAFPDAHLGNFSFFDVSDKVEIIRSSRHNTEFKSEVGFVLWFDYRKVYPADWEQRTIENIKVEVLAAFRTMVLTESSIAITGTYERATSIYKGYTDREIKDQFLMRPYGGLRVDFTLKYSEKTSC